MAYFREADLQWYTSQEKMHKLLRIQPHESTKSAYLTPGVANVLLRSPLLAVGTIDLAGRTWTSVWGGKSGFSRSVGESTISVTAIVDQRYDPIIETLLERKASKNIGEEQSAGRVVSCFGIDLEARKRVEIYGRTISCVLATMDDNGASEAQVVIRVEQSSGSSPKYLNRKHVIPSVLIPQLISTSIPLVQDAIDLLAKADMFFISCSNHELDMDTNHRAGPVGFVRLDANDESGCVLVFPEYSGTRLYQTLGASSNSPQAGLVFPDFDTGDVLYITGSTEILMRKDAVRVLPKRNVAVKIKVTATRFVKKGLSFRATQGFSPYNPPVQLLIKERHYGQPSSNKQVLVMLLDNQLLTPTIGRFRFHLSGSEKVDSWKPGQYVSLNFEKEFEGNTGVINSNYIRTFTVSSGPGNKLEPNQFEITIRKVGVVTEHLFSHDSQRQLEVPLVGFGGEFLFKQNEGERIGFIAGGIGITPLLAQVAGLDFALLHIYWTIRAEDLGLVLDSFKRAPGLVGSTKLFITGEINATIEDKLTKLTVMNASIERQRIVVEDLQLESGNGRLIEKWYVCAGAGLRTTVLEWLKYRNVVFETFNY